MKVPASATQTILQNYDSLKFQQNKNALPQKSASSVQVNERSGSSYSLNGSNNYQARLLQNSLPSYPCSTNSLPLSIDGFMPKQMSQTVCTVTDSCDSSESSTQSCVLSNEQALLRRPRRYAPRDKPRRQKTKEKPDRQPGRIPPREPRPEWLPDRTPSPGILPDRYPFIDPCLSALGCDVPYPDFWVDS